MLMITTMLALLIWSLSGPDLCEQTRGEWVPIGVETSRLAGIVERERTVYECRGGDQTAGTLVVRIGG